MNLFYQPLTSEGVHYLDEEESRHCIKVLRKRNGDAIRITDGKGNFYESRIKDDSPRRCSFTIIEQIPAPPRPCFIQIAVSPTKNSDRIEWFVEKAVELGIDKITLMACDHTERSFIKTERLFKVAISAMKQSLKARLPLIEPLTPIREIISNNSANQKYIAFVDSANPVLLKNIARSSDRYLILIGPEGDFSPEEMALAVEHGFAKVSLGESRLRTETAALAACHILNLINS